MNFTSNLTSVWDFFKNTNKPIILYGMGDGADKVIREFDKLNIKPYGVMASDDFVRGQKFHDFIKEVQPLAVVCGHIHEGAGIEKIGDTVVINPGSLGEKGSYGWLTVEKDGDGKWKAEAELIK